MNLRTPTSPHIHSGASVTTVMLRVVYALVPGIALYWWFFGAGVLVNIALALLTALVCEALMLWARKRPVAPFLLDASAVVTALLLAVSIPPLAPWWLIVVGTGFAIVVAKHLFGGLGYNLFNPAMIGYVMLLISFPREMTAWQAPLMLTGHDLSAGDTLRYVFAGELPPRVALDAVTGATPLDTLKTQLRLDKTVAQIAQAHPQFGTMGGKGWEWISLAWLAGGLWLIYKRVISWHIPAAMLGTLGLISGVFYLADSQHHASPLFHLIAGGAMLGAFFIATDPVTAATTLRGRLLYGAGIGVLTYVIRAWGGFPEGVAFAVLLMNTAVPTLDYYTRPRVFGHGKKKS